jgi:hypothetical protein
MELFSNGKKVRPVRMLQADFTEIYHDTDKKNNYSWRRTGASDCTHMCRSEMKRFSCTFGDYAVKGC